MIFSKSNFFTIIFLILNICFCLPGCSQQKEQASRSSESSFVESKAFQDYLQYYTGNEESTIYSEKRLLTLIGEEAFLHCKIYDYYIVYFYKAFQDSIYYVYTIKSVDEISMGSVKKFKYGYPIYLKKGDSESLLQFKVDVLSKIADEKIVKTILNAHDEAIKKATKGIPSEYDAPLRNIYYFDGHDYHFINDYQVGESLMNELDLFFKIQQYSRLWTELWYYNPPCWKG